MKQPNWRAPLILSTALFVLGSFAYWLQYSHKPKKEKEDTQVKKPLALPSEDTQIAQFRFKGAAQIIEGKCNSLAQKTCKISTLGDWAITYPASYKGDAESIKDALNNAASMVASETIDIGEETPEKRKQLLDEYGLSDEKRTKLGTEFIELTLEDGKKLTAWFGEQHPVGDKTFVGSSVNGTLNEKTVFLIANFYKSVFEKGLSHFRDKTILTFDRKDVNEINATTSHGKFSAKQIDGKWVINEKPGDHDRIETVLASISQLKAKDFPAENTLKGAKSILKYQFKTKAAEYSLELLEKTTGSDKAKVSHYYVRASGVNEPFEVEPQIRSSIDKSIVELRQTVLVSQAEKVTSTSLKLEGKAFGNGLDFHFDGKAWAAKDPNQKIDVSHISKLIDALTSSRAQEILASAPAKTESVTLSLGDDKNPTKTHLLFFKSKEKDKVYVQDLNQKSNEAFLIDNITRNAFPFTPDSWKLK